MRPFILVLLACLVALLPAAASAQEPDDDNDDNGFTLRIRDDLVVGEGESIGTLVVIDADVQVRGTIRDTLVVINGVATIAQTGIVRNDITVISGDLVLDAGSRVDDVTLVSSDLDRSPDATVQGDIDERDNFGGWGWGAALFFGFAFWLVMTIAILIAGVIFALVASRQVLTATSYMTARVGQSILAGILVVFVLPIIAVLLILTLIGVAAGLGVLLFVLPAILFLGYLVAGTWLGMLILSRASERLARPPIAPAIVGLLILQLIALIPFIGWIVFPIGGIWGTGALAYYAWNAMRGREQAPIPSTATPASESAGSA